jgi:DNA-binding CsgD family transcriptional regulator
MNAPVNIKRTAEGYEFNGLVVSGFAPQESRVLLLRAAGFNVKECSRNLNCGVQAIKSRTSNLFYKLGANSTPELIVKAFKSGHLRLLTLMLALHVSLFAPFLDSQRDVIARTGRTRPRPTHRVTRVMRSDGLFWNPETNELV